MTTFDISAEISYLNHLTNFQATDLGDYAYRLISERAADQATIELLRGTQVVLLGADGVTTAPAYAAGQDPAVDPGVREQLLRDAAEDVARQFDELEQAYVETIAAVNQHHGADEDGRCPINCAACSITAAAPADIVAAALTLNARIH